MFPSSKRLPGTDKPRLCPTQACTVPVPPAVQDVLARVDELVPALQARAGETERLRQMHPDTLCDLRNAGVFLLTMSTDVRGYEADDATIADVVAQISRGCTTGWSTTQVPS